MGSAARETIEVRVNLLDAAGKEIASKIGYASLSYLKPGEISPFSVLFSKDDTRRRHSPATRSRFAAARPISSPATPTAI